MGATSSGRRIVRRIGFGALGALVLALVGFLVWADLPMRAEPGPLAAARADPAIAYHDDGSTVVLTPRHPDGTGLVLFAGARVDAPAYAWKLSGVAEAGVTVVIVRPVLNFALLDPRPLTAFEAAAPGIRRWLVGGHSLGGVRACRDAAGGGTAGLVLLGSYCADDLSRDRLPVLSIGGSRDGLSTPARIAAARHLLPPGADLVELPGVDHAQFGDYGPQPGDHPATASDQQARRGITAEVVRFLDRQGLLTS